MEAHEAARYVDELYAVFFARIPETSERGHWIGVLSSGTSEGEVFRLFKDSREYKVRSRVRPAFPPGHYYSPIVDPVEARKFARVRRDADPAGLAGLDVSLSAIKSAWYDLEPFIRSSEFPEEKLDGRRYYAENNVYPIGDAAILRAMMLRFRPRRIIEIGSGFSSAVMLDTLDEAGDDSARLTFIEPNAQRLKSLLRPDDLGRVEMVESPVQAVDVRLFSELAENDILFIDSTHVMKTGSDVNFELFEILPRLAAGTLIHFHDIHFPFEYPDAWVYGKMYSWNEIYALRAFLMYNASFKIFYFNSLFAGRFPELVSDAYPEMLKNPGGSLWLRKVS